VNVELCTAVAGGAAGETIEVDDERGEWLITNGYAVQPDSEGRHRAKTGAKRSDLSAAPNAARTSTDDDEDDDEDDAPNANDDDHIDGDRSFSASRKRGSKSSRR